MLSFIRVLFIGALAVCIAPAVWANVSPPPSGPAVVTVAGKITKQNRGPVDAFLDAYFKFNDVDFDKAVSFDVKALQSLGMKKLKVSYPTWPKAYDFEGPLLADVLAATGANGETVTVKALDGYTAEISMRDIGKYPILLALKRDGQFLGLGGRGPAWVVFPRDDYPELQTQDDAKWVWSVYFIKVD